ncbi:MAG: chromosomal replication initiator protein DnaA [Actinomycetota bacterium]
MVVSVSIDDVTASASSEAPDPPASPQDLWSKTSIKLKEQISEGNFSAWFGSARGVGFEGGTFLIGVPSPFTKEWIDTRYSRLLRPLVSECAGTELGVTIVVDPQVAGSDTETPGHETGSDKPLAPAASPGNPTPQFHPKYTFDSFVIGSSNRFAHAAALAVAEQPAEAYNPLFIYGGAGLGKTHLLHAIGRYIAECHPRLIVRYVSTEQFMNDFIQSVQRNRIPEFHGRFRVGDLLLVDDIQLLEGKERTQEEFFHTFNALHPRSQIVITSDRPPKKMPALEERLRTRFEWGLITDVQPPDLETRLAILQKKAEADGLCLPRDVMEFIASRVQTNIRELEGALIRVAAYASLTRAEVTLELAQELLHSLLPGSDEARVTAAMVINVAGDYFSITPEEITSSSRSRELVLARQMAMYLCRELTDLSLIEIGKRFGGRDHSTVIYATNKIRQQMQERQNCYEQVNELTARIRQQAARG